MSQRRSELQAPSASLACFISLEAMMRRAGWLGHGRGRDRLPPPRVPDRTYGWYAGANGRRRFYAAAWIDGAQVHMHKYLCPNWAQVKHETGNGLDNRRENLRGVGRAD
jgi:hypothetical protein